MPLRMVGILTEILSSIFTYLCLPRELRFRGNQKILFGVRHAVFTIATTRVRDEAHVVKIGPTTPKIGNLVVDVPTPLVRQEKWRLYVGRWDCTD